MCHKSWKLRLLYFLAIAGAVSVYPVSAQVTPDSTLGAEQSIVNSSPRNSSLQQQIEGGAIRGSNLFHSFRDFNIPEGQSLYFRASEGIQNIFSRVTGGNLSTINGTLGVLGSAANVFLINPNGIIFGANARLDVRGSFVATTATAIQFGDQGFFSSSAPDTPPLLTVNPSAFLFSQIAPTAIVNRSKTPLETGGQGLQVPDGKSLLLLGGDLDLAGGGMNAAEGRVELGAIAGIGTVALSLEDNNLRLSFPITLDRADISLTNNATVNTSGEGGGSIQIWGRRVLMNGESQVAAFTQGSRPGGNLAVNASESLEVIGSAAFGNLSTLSFGDGNAGALLIETRRLRVREGAQLLAGTLGNGSAGQLSVNATESIEVGGRGDNPNDFSSLASFTGGTAQAGNITLNTKKLIVQDGGVISTQSIIASENGEFFRVSGEGGNLTINASDSVILSGQGFVLTDTQSTGNAGNLVINTERLLVQDNSTISASSRLSESRQSSENAGSGGNIIVRSRSIALNNQSSIRAETEAGQGGNITLQVEGFLLSRRDSLISTTAGTTQAGGDGGNITIDSKFIVAVARENSDITANAFLGRGGNVRITTQNIFGIEPRFRETALSDITASSEFGINGTITLNTPDVDPSRGITTLPTDVQDPSQLIAMTCPADEGNSFAITGRGGLPEDPRQPLMSADVWLDDRFPGQVSLPTAQAVPMIMEAQGWIKYPDGSIHLVANEPGSTIQAFQPLLCAVRSR